jgi:hypothetical protein
MPWSSRNSPARCPGPRGSSQLMTGTAPVSPADARGSRNSPARCPGPRGSSQLMTGTARASPADARVSRNCPAGIRSSDVSGRRCQARPCRCPACSRPCRAALPRLASPPRQREPRGHGAAAGPLREGAGRSGRTFRGPGSRSRTTGSRWKVPETECGRRARSSRQDPGEPKAGPFAHSQTMLRLRVGRALAPQEAGSNPGPPLNPACRGPHVCPALPPLSVAPLPPTQPLPLPAA